MSKVESATLKWVETSPGSWETESERGKGTVSRLTYRREKHEVSFLAYWEWAWTGGPIKDSYFKTRNFKTEEEAKQAVEEWASR
jgi:hypothetical protein